MSAGDSIAEKRLHVLFDARVNDCATARKLRKKSRSVRKLKPQKSREAMLAKLASDEGLASIEGELQAIAAERRALTRLRTLLRRVRASRQAPPSEA